MGRRKPEEGGGQVQGGEGQRFRYGGYWVELVDVRPVEWVYDDDYYIDRLGADYYLIESMHPGLGLLIIVVD
jgi:hypothetical protein